MPSTEVDLISAANGNELLALAGCAIRYGIEHRRAMQVDADCYPVRLRVAQASFVTLERGRRLRGCIGSLEALHPLVRDVAANAYAAAFRDPRFEPLQAGELADLDIHISILGPASPIRFDTEADLVTQLCPGIDGVILQQGRRRATFLPSVWDSLRDPVEFLRELKHKAGIVDSCRDQTLSAWRYTAVSFEGRSASD